MFYDLFIIVLYSFIAIYLIASLYESKPVIIIIIGISLGVIAANILIILREEVEKYGTYLLVSSVYLISMLYYINYRHTNKR